jgi:hypothetical protein
MTSEWTRLAEHLIARRVELGHPRRPSFYREHEMSSGQQRTIEDIENARRTNYAPSTRAWVEQVYRWQVGSIRSVLAGGDPSPMLERHDSGRFSDPEMRVLFDTLINATPEKRANAARVALAAARAVISNGGTQQ